VTIAARIHSDRAQLFLHQSEPPVVATLATFAILEECRSRTVESSRAVAEDLDRLPPRAPAGFDTEEFG